MIRRKKARFVDAFLRRDMMAKEVKKLAGRLEDAVRVFDVSLSLCGIGRTTQRLPRRFQLLMLFHAGNRFSPRYTRTSKSRRCCSAANTSFSTPRTLSALRLRC